MARILMILGRNRSSRRNLSFQKFSNERKIIESIDWIGRSIVSIDGHLDFRTRLFLFWRPRRVSRLFSCRRGRCCRRSRRPKFVFN